MNEVIPLKEEMVLPRRYGLVPESMGEAMKLAEMMAGAKLVPAALQKSPADCLMVIQQAIRWDMDPFAVAQECSVIQGKLMHSGKLVAAVVNARGNLTQRLSFEYKGAGDERTITVAGLLRGESQPRSIEVTLKNAKTTASVWKTQPDQQLMYHGTRVWARRHTPELMLGVWSPEEFDEQAPVQRKPAAAAPNAMLTETAANHNPSTDEVIEQATDPMQAGKEAAERGTDALKTWWESIGAPAQKKLKGELPGWKKTASDADKLAADAGHDEAPEETI